ncbi:autophagy-related protein 2 [Marasmius crinis-equi]|uniref:Autophagy-related protein 2 n=1 Tax=Marasmius crinis-equi TaxID=585013 RepID=A0ABR3EU65_9AGAR
MPSLSWLSWLTTLPSSLAPYWSLPLNIQTKFIKWTYKKFILDLLKPGHIDEDELDAQIESDFVQLRDIDVNEKVLNDLLPTLPFSLQHASIKRASLKLSYGNDTILTTSLSIESSEFCFRILPPDETSYTLPTSLPDLIGSYAAAFVRDGARSFCSWNERSCGGFEGNLINVFTTLAERVLSDVEIEATNTSFVLVHPEQCRLRVTIASICIRTNTSQEQQNERRHTIRLSGITAHLSDLTGSSKRDAQILSFGSNPVTIVVVRDASTKLRISVDVGVVGGSLHSWDLSRLIPLIDTCLSHREMGLACPASLNPELFLETSVSLKIESILVLFHQPDSLSHSALDAFFTNPSFFPPSSNGYVRLNLDTITMQLSSRASFGPGPDLLKCSCTLSVADFSIFGWRGADVDGNEGVEPMFPIVITDPYSPFSYDNCPKHIRPPNNPRERFDLPEFEVVDWTDEELCSVEPDPAHWRTKLPGIEPSKAKEPAVKLNLKYCSTEPSRSSASVEVAPLRVFIDLGQVLDEGVLNYSGDVILAFLSTAAYVTGAGPFEANFTSPLIRAEIRCPLSGLPTRSGALVIDVHDAHLVRNLETPSPCSDNEKEEETILSIGASRILVACSSATSDNAHTVLSIGPVTTNHRLLPPQANEEFAGDIRLGVSRNQTIPRLTLFLDLPSVVGQLTGGTLDALQYWLLDASYIISIHSEPDSDCGLPLETVRRPDVYQVLTDIGRCLLARPDTPTTEGCGADFESVIKIAVDEAVIRLLVPVTNVDGSNAAIVHCVDFLALTLDALVVFKVRMTITLYRDGLRD